MAMIVMSSEKENRTRIDVSKTAQWEIVMEHADKMGMFMHFKLQEYENDQLLDDGALGVERILYFRELIARSGHQGEENTNTHKAHGICRVLSQHGSIPTSCRRAHRSGWQE
jgi:hypothetical protein